MAENKDALELAIALIDKQYGKGSIMRLGASNVEPWPCIPTGALPLDIILGGGLPKGRIVEIFGTESAGKSTIALSVVAQAQKMGGICAYIDAENALDPVYMQNLGVNLDDLLLSQPSTGEEAIDICETIVKTGMISLVIIDSVAALVPRAELEGDMSAQHMGLQPRLMAKAMRKLVGLAAETKTCIVFINQIREKIGIMFGNPETQPGGRALKFFSSVRVDLRRKEDIKNKDGVVIGTRVTAKTVKNKMAPALRKVEFDILYGEGVSYFGCIADMAVEYGLIKKSGAWYSYEEEQMGQGRDQLVQNLSQDIDLAESLRKKIFDAV